MVSSKPLKNQTVIVTGATRGIGRAIALKLAAQGANIAFNYAKSDELADSLKAEIEQLGVSVLAFKMDIKDYAEAQKMKEAVLEKFGRLDILVNNAGIIKDGALMAMSRENWLDVIDTNLNGTFNMTKAVIVTFMKQRRGAIVNISSISGVRGMAGQTNYSASKGGIISFTKALAKEVAPFNVRVNAVAPGFIETDMVAGLTEDRMKRALEAVPLGRFGRAKEVAEAVSFLSDGRGDYITGQVLEINGGFGI